jgi:hypothetical protein
VPSRETKLNPYKTTAYEDGVFPESCNLHEGRRACMQVAAFAVG